MHWAPAFPQSCPTGRDPSPLRARLPDRHGPTLNHADPTETVLPADEGIEWAAAHRAAAVVFGVVSTGTWPGLRNRSVRRFIVRGHLSRVDGWSEGNPAERTEFLH